MNENTKVLRRLAAGAGAVGTTLMLASCGGDGGGGNNDAPPVPPVTSNTPPASTSASPEGFIAYLKTVVAIQSDTADPLDLTGFVAPVADTSEPDASI